MVNNNDDNNQIANTSISNNVIDEKLLGTIHRKVLTEQEFSADKNKRREEKLQAIAILNEPIRRLEFNVLLHMCDENYKPYKNIRLTSEEYNNYCSPKKRYYVSFPKSEIENILPILDDFRSVLATVEYGFNRTRIVFRHTDLFKQFTDSKFMGQDKLYKKLFGLSVDNRIKVLYYFLYHYKYNFLTTLRENISVYDSIVKLDDYFCYQGYHKRVIGDTQ